MEKSKIIFESGSSIFDNITIILGQRKINDRFFVYPANETYQDLVKKYIRKPDKFNLNRILLEQSKSLLSYQNPITKESIELDMAERHRFLVWLNIAICNEYTIKETRYNANHYTKRAKEAVKRTISDLRKK